MVYEVKIGSVIATVDYNGDAVSLCELLKSKANETRDLNLSGINHRIASHQFCVGGFYFDYRWFYDTEEREIKLEITECPMSSTWRWCPRAGG